MMISDLPSYLLKNQRKKKKKKKEVQGASPVVTIKQKQKTTKHKTNKDE